MGSPKEEEGKYGNEGPQPHSVTDIRVLHGQVRGDASARRAVVGCRVFRVTDPDPSGFKGDNLPVERVSWDDAVEFCARLSQATGKKYRLPTEAEWEYACRAGTKTAFAFGNNLSSKQANFKGLYPYGGASKGPYLQSTTSVGSYQPNKWGSVRSAWECLGVVLGLVWGL